LYPTFKGLVSVFVWSGRHNKNFLFLFFFFFQTLIAGINWPKRLQLAITNKIEPRRTRPIGAALTRVGPSLLRSGALKLLRQEPILRLLNLQLYCETAGLTLDEVIDSNCMSQMNVF
jgi:hypothetical protein